MIKPDLDDLITSCLEDRNVEELALGFLRYEALRKLPPSKYTALHIRNLNGEKFDDMVDDLILEN